MPLKTQITGVCSRDEGIYWGTFAGPVHVKKRKNYRSEITMLFALTKLFEMDSEAFLGGEGAKC